jgi:hypothetical protein
MEPPPEAVTVKTVTNSEPLKDTVLLFIIKDKKVFYSYAKIADSVKPKKIFPPTEENIVSAIDTIEQIYKVDMKSKSDNIIIKSSSEDIEKNYSLFKIVKAAFRKKEIYKFRMVTTNENE